MVQRIKKAVPYMLYAVGAIAVIVLLGLGTAGYRFLKEPVSDVLEAAPANSLLVLKSRDLSNLRSEIGGSGIKGVLTLKKNAQIDSIFYWFDTLQAGSKFFGNLMEKNTGGIVWVPDTGGQVHKLYVLTVGKTSWKTLRRNINGLFRLNDSPWFQNDTAAVPVLRAQIDSMNWYAYKHHGLLAFSPDSSTVAASYHALDSARNVFSAEGVKHLLKTEGKGVSGTLYINSRAFLSSLLENNGGSNFSPFNNWTSLDLNFMPDATDLVGYTTLGKDKGFLEGQRVGKMSLLQALPSQTAVAYTYKFPDMPRYIKRNLPPDSIVSGDFLSGEDFHIFWVDEHIKSWVGAQLAKVYSTGYFRGNKRETAVMIEVFNDESAEEMLAPYLTAVEDRIFAFRMPDMPRRLFGETFAQQDPQYLVKAPGYIIISPSRSFMQHYVQQLRLPTLKARSAFLNRSISRAVGEGNVHVYVNSRNAVRKLIGQGGEYAAFRKDLADILNATHQITVEYGLSTDASMLTRISLYHKAPPKK